MAPTLTRFADATDRAAIAAALRQDGAVIVERVAPRALCERIKEDLRPYFDRDGRATESDFKGYRTLRVSGVLAKSRATADLIGHDLVMGMADAILLPFCLAYRIGSTTGIEIHPGESAQRLHRDDAIYPMRIPGVEWQVDVMWALDDFTEENGATRVVPGSHAWKEPRQVAEEDVTQSVMDQGSALLYLGSVWHGGGANRSNRPRMGLINTYALGWLRQEVNQYLAIPRDIAMSYPDRIRRLIGYDRHGRLLGFWPDDPDDPRR
jgi:hypothetical protein